MISVCWLKCDLLVSRSAEVLWKLADALKDRRFVRALLLVAVADLLECLMHVPQCCSWSG
jgi:hypothetical protein